MPKQIGHLSLNPGRYSGFCAGRPGFVAPFRRTDTPRLMYHSGLDQVLEYPQTPDRTYGFQYDVLGPVLSQTKATFTSNILQQWAAVQADVVIREVFEGDLSQTWEFFNQLWTFFITIPNPGEYVLWRPFDRTDKLYRISLLKISVGGDDLDLTFVGVDLIEKWLRAPVEISFKLDPAFPPAANFFATGPLVSN